MNDKIALVFSKKLAAKNPKLGIVLGFDRDAFHILAVRAKEADVAIHDPSQRAAWPWKFVWSFDVVVESKAAFELSLGSRTTRLLPYANDPSAGSINQLWEYIKNADTLYISGVQQIAAGLTWVTQKPDDDSEPPKFPTPGPKAPTGVDL